MDDQYKWRMHRPGRVGDHVIGGVAGACARALSQAWMTAAERSAIDTLAARRGIDHRLATFLAPEMRYAAGGRFSRERVLGWMQWASERPEPELTALIEAFEFYVAFGGDADFRTGGRSASRR